VVDRSPAELVVSDGADAVRLSSVSLNSAKSYYRGGACTLIEENDSGDGEAMLRAFVRYYQAASYKTALGRTIRIKSHGKLSADGRQVSLWRRLDRREGRNV
jgi:hypothetical protein